MSEDSKPVGWASGVPDPPQQDTTARTILIVLGVLGGIVLCCCVVVAGLLISGAVTLAGVFGEIIEGPYNLASRPTPTDSAADTLMPLTVGTFTRTLLSGNAEDGYEATYEGRGATIRVVARAYRTTSDARRRVEEIKRELEVRSGTRMNGDLPNISYTFYKDFSSFARVAWSRAGYFFDASTENGHDAFDEFMEAFPY